LEAIEDSFLDTFEFGKREGDFLLIKKHTFT
jgi:hypothetical protein